MHSMGHGTHRNAMISFVDPTDFMSASRVQELGWVTRLYYVQTSCEG